MKHILLLILILGFEPSKAQDFSVGLIADCQYCDCDYNKKWNNDYRKGLPRLQEAVTIFNDNAVDLTFHLGDFIDRDFNSFNEVSPIFESLAMPHYHVLGNHDFSVADSLKPLVPLRLGLKQPYYKIATNNWLFIVLDGTDISLYKTNDTGTINDAEKNRAYYQNLGRNQAKPWNGAVGGLQMVWLESQLKNAEKVNQKVVVFCHFPILPESSANLWNDVELVQLIEKYTAVKAFINGHHHSGNYVVHNSIHYLTLQGMVRSKEETAFAIITLKKHQIEVNGFGREPNRVLKFK